MILVSFTYIGPGNCVNSIEREVRGMTATYPVIKSWLVFMERRVLVCGQNRNGVLNTFNFLRCLSTEGNRKEMCLYGKIDRCRIIVRGGNVFSLKSLYTRSLFLLRIEVNRVFSLNLTFGKLDLCNNKKKAFYCMDYMDVRIGNKSERFTEHRLSWTVLSKHTSAMISINNPIYNLHIEFEYSIIEKSNHEYTIQWGTYDFHYNYFQIERVHIVVEIIYRIHVEISGCFQCKIIAHDGPHEIFPTILRKTTGPRDLTSFYTSAHYCLVFMASETVYNTTVIRYNAVFVVYTTFTLNTPTQLMFDNNTRCNDNTNQVRSCVFKIRAPDDSNVKLTLTEIQIKGVHVGIDFAAGFVVYNVVGGRPEKVSELLESATYFPVHGIPFTSTESVMYVVIFAYSVCASIFARAVTIAESCNGKFVTMSLPITTAIIYLDNSADITCFRVQTVSVYRGKNSASKFSIRVNPNITVFVDLSYVVLYRDNSRCHFNLFNDLQNTHYVKPTKKGYHSYIGNIKKVDWKCSPDTKIMITEIKAASCDLPCRLLFRTKAFEQSRVSCNVCHFKYLGGLWSTHIFNKEINRTALIDLRIFSSHCGTVNLLFVIDPMWRSAAITVDVNRNQTFSMASQLGVRILYESRCMISLPRHAFSVEYDRYSIPEKMRAPINFIWRDVLYRVTWSDRELSWTYTARECHKYGGSLLVVHDQMEYHQIEHLMHKFAIGVLYVGLKHKVNHKLLSIVLWRNGVEVSFGIIRTCHDVNQLSCWIYFRIRHIYIYIYIIP